MNVNGPIPQRSRRAETAVPGWRALLCVLGSVFLHSGVPAGNAADYTRDIKPILRDRCYACHGALKQKAELRLDTVVWMLKGGESGPALKPGNATASRLVSRIETSDPDDRMPPEHEGEILSPDQVALVRTWIEGGAVGPADEVPEADPKDHWAFRPRIRPLVPSVSRAEWVRNPIDAFIARTHEQNGLVPQGEASRSELVRRLYIDLVGVPPTVDDIGGVDVDSAPGWYERLADRLLDDPRHGERWARHWMDIWRYSDAWGLGEQLRNSQRHIWRWRDWIVESLNADTSYDEMVRLMLAADELYPGDLDKHRATGFLARNYFLFNRNQWMDEVVEHVGKGLLGLTLNCAKCHDHKYDPIPQADYYRMRAFFEPYHVRLDMVPGEPDLNRDGIPRAFDGHPETPTYRFVRGQENQPEKSAEMLPGIPEFLAFQPVVVRPVPLPMDAWQPERRPWVLEAYRAAARTRLESTGKDVINARVKVSEALGGFHGLNSVNRGQDFGDQGPSGATPAATNGRLSEAGARDVAEAEAFLAVAEEGVVLARVEAAGVESRIAAMRAAWKLTDGTSVNSEGRGKLAVDEQNLARQALQADREIAVARARLALASARLRGTKAKDDDTRTAAQTEQAKAREALDKAIAEASALVPSEGGTYTRLLGAAWTPTRFLDSTKDDPRVEFLPVSTGRRKALAEWITDPRHPLTARVGVNHVWNRHFGEPLVASVFDFGRKGALPVHPALLDWLACEWVDSGWSLKHLHRLIVTSATYRMSSEARGGEASAARDPDNQYGWRRTPIRLEAQVVRDAILAHAGQLELKRGGPPVAASAQADSKRRSLYFHHSNNERNLFLTTFDDAAVKECYRREQSIVPQQALALSHSRWVHDAAPHIAKRLSAGEGGTAGGAEGEAAFVRRAFQVLLGFEPGAAEIGAALRAMAAWRALPTEGGGGTDEAARAGLVWALLNHNDFVTLR